MPDPIAGRLGSLIMTAWVSETRSGDQAVVLLSTPDLRARSTMPGVAVLLGLPDEVDPEVALMVRPDGWLRLTLPGGEHVERPGGDKVNAVAVAVIRLVRLTHVGQRVPLVAHRLSEPALKRS